MILNLKENNHFLPDQKFHMEYNPPALVNSDKAVSIDLKDAYFHVLIHPLSRFLGFQYNDRTFLYVLLPFGFKDSPLVFSRIVATAVAFFF